MKFACLHRVDVSLFQRRLCGHESRRKMGDRYYAAGLNRSPIFFETEKSVWTGTRPATLNFPTAARPAEAMQPHSEHTGLPPNWQGLIFVCRSAEMQVVFCAKMHWSGEDGGRRKPSQTCRGISNLFIS